MLIFSSICVFVLLMSIFTILVLSINYFLNHEPEYTDREQVVLIICLFTLFDLFGLGRIFVAGMLTLIGGH